MEEKVKSQFFAAVTDALDKAMPVRTSDDSVLMVIADGVTASHLCGGDADTLQAVLLNFMQKNPKVAEIVCYTALGLRKSRAYKFALGQKNSTHGVATRFQKGQQPPNKGKKEWQFRSREGIEKCRATQFKPGQAPHNAHPVGFEKVYSDGYLYIKTADAPKMRLKHIVVWEQHNGPVPPGIMVTFTDGDHLNCSIDNLRLMTRAEAGKLIFSRQSPERRAEIQAKIQTNRNETIRKDKMRIRWGLPPKSKLVSRWHAPEPRPANISNNT